jgi:hypothetical protein
MSDPTYTKQQTIWCSHPELIPNKWNQERPQGCEMTRLCDCGANQSCHICGWGQGSLPCPCRPADYSHVKQIFSV